LTAELVFDAAGAGTERVAGLSAAAWARGLLPALPTPHLLPVVATARHPLDPEATTLQFWYCLRQASSVMSLAHEIERKRWTKGLPPGAACATAQSAMAGTGASSDRLQATASIRCFILSPHAKI
jgi:hypothetical protein